MKLKCIANVKGYFTKGKEYEVITRKGFLYVIIDDDGEYRNVDLCTPFGNYFEVLDEK